MAENSANEIIEDRCIRKKKEGEGREEVRKGGFGRIMSVLAVIFRSQ